MKNIYFFEGWSRENRRQKKLKKYRFYFLKTYIFWRAGRWKIGGKKKLKINISFIFLKLIFFGGLVAGKSAAKKTEKNISFIFLKLIFLGGLVAGKSAAKKTEQHINFIFLKLIFFGGLVAGKSAAKKTEHISFICF